MSRWEADLCSEVAPVVLDWLWPGYVPRGKLVILDGDPEMGKSLLTIDLIARLSRGGQLPDGSPLSRAHTSVLISAEDGRADTIRPRAEAAGADLSRLILPRFGGRVPRFPEEIAGLEELIVDRGVDLVVLDPLMAFLPPSVAANLDQCVRLALSPLSQLAFWTGCTILLIRHLTKKWWTRALLRGQGSVGIAAAVRAGLLVGPHPDAGVGAAAGVPPSGGAGADDRRKAGLQRASQRVLAVAKTNLEVRPPSL
ncbi:MAG TPA: AAA family ATPase, partial [Gemmataceae bacterium]|nr:AAA family ATPase [Gemmataceae bacterium]